MKTHSSAVSDPVFRQGARPASLALGLLILLGAVSALAYDVNKDIRNLGPAAQDLHVILSGPETITSHFDGYSPGTGTGVDGRFHQFSWGPEGPNTQLTWREFWDGQDRTIDSGQAIHVGWSTADGHCQILDMWWTDGNGQRIPGSVVFNITSKTTYESAVGTAVAIWENVFAPQIMPPQPITVMNVHFAVLTNGLPLDQLNAANSMLATNLHLLQGGAGFTLPPGGVMELPVPGTWPGAMVVLRYQVADPTGLGETTDFIQAQAGQLTLPVYQVVGAGVTPAQANLLAGALGIPPTSVSLSNGVVSFIDPTNFLGVPMMTVGNDEVFDFAALNSLVPYPDGQAQARTFMALSQADLVPQDAEARRAFAALTLQYKDPDTGERYDFQDRQVDTQVEYSFSANGYPLVGPGAQIQVSYAPGGQVTHLLYSARTLQPSVVTPLPPIEMVLTRAAALYPGLTNPLLEARLIYYAPAWTAGTPVRILPCYDIGGTAEVGGQPVNLTRRILYVLPDPTLVPQVGLLVTNSGQQVSATALVNGGLPPYTFDWAASSPDLDSSGPSVLYTPLIPVESPSLAIRLINPELVELTWPADAPAAILEGKASLDQLSWTPIPDPGVTNDGLHRVTLNLTQANMFFRLRCLPQSVMETVILTVTDANGVQVQSTATLLVQATPVARESLSGLQRPGRTDYGIESPFDAGLGSTDRRDFQTAMRRPGMGGGTQQFCWLDQLAWERDFKEPPRWAGGLDSLYCDNVDLCFYVGHGWPFGITFVNPVQSKAWLLNTDVGALGGWTGAWGDVDLEWMTLLSCQVLQGNWANPAQNAFSRWVPAFDGLHLLCGFDTVAWARTGFPRDFGDRMLGWSFPWRPVPIRTAWFAANVAKQPRGTTAAVMGVIGRGGVNNFNDYYWGKGPVGPTLRPPFMGAWWMAVRRP